MAGGRGKAGLWGQEKTESFIGEVRLDGAPVRV